MARTTQIELTSLIEALAGTDETDDASERILDATLATLVAVGMRRCTVEEIAERAQIGRSTIYRRFDGRDELIHAVVARELRRFVDTLGRSVDHLDDVTDRVVEGFLTGLEIANTSDFLRFLRSEPDLMVFLMRNAYPATEAVTTLMIGELLRSTKDPASVDIGMARHVAEVVFRLAVSFVSVPGTTLPLDDREAARAALYSIFHPLLEATT